MTSPHPKNHIKGVSVLRSTGTQTDFRHNRVFLFKEFHFALPQVGICFNIQLKFHYFVLFQLFDVISLLSNYFFLESGSYWQLPASSSLWFNSLLINKGMECQYRNK